MNSMPASSPISKSWSIQKSSSLAVALTVSLFIYVFYRSEKTVVNELMIFILSFDTYSEIKSLVNALVPLPESVVFSLPGGLWIFCVTMLSQRFYMKLGNRELPVLILPIVFVIGLEFCQLLHLTNGRFDVWDIVLYLLFWFLAYDPFDGEVSRQNILSSFTFHSFMFLACFLSVYLAHVSQ